VCVNYKVELMLEKG